MTSLTAAQRALYSSAAGAASGGGSQNPPSLRRLNTTTTAAARVTLSPTTTNDNNSGSRPRYVVPMFQPAPYAAPPPHLPPPPAFVDVDFEQTKREIFNMARNKIQSSAQYTKNGRKPFTQLTVMIPLSSSSGTGTGTTPNRTTTPEEDLAIVYSLMHESTRRPVRETDDSTTWYLSGLGFLDWLLGVDQHETMRPMDKYVHPIQFDTGEVERKRLEKRISKGVGKSSDLLRLETLKKKKNHPPEEDNDYYWAAYEECVVTFKHTKQPRKQKYHELQLTLKIRTFHAGSGNPRNHAGLMVVSRMHNLADMDPTTKIYQHFKELFS